ncbi:MAG TPA: hypothetical protein VN946_01540 [Terriglobales bacterium]|nr:hypothetical protein [Terriglobales bacterium]
MSTPSEISAQNRSQCNQWRRHPWLWLLLLGTSLCAVAASAQTCQSATDMSADVQSALRATAGRYFEMAAHGDTATLRQNSIPAVAANFAAIEAVVKENQTTFAGAKATVRPPFLLIANGPEPLTRAEFLCGVFGRTGQTENSAVFVLPNLPPGKYGVTILDVNSAQTAATLTFILQQDGTEWKLGGLYVRSSQASGHDATWFIQHARDFKAKSKNRDAWLYYREAIALSIPVDFMSTLSTDKLYEEAQSTQPADLPANGNVVDLNAGGKIYHLTEIFPLAVGNDLDVVVKYQCPDVSDTAHTFQENMVVIKALVAKFPELREAMAGVVARAVEPSGRDYGSLLAMKDIK